MGPRIAAASGTQIRRSSRIKAKNAETIPTTTGAAKKSGATAVRPRPRTTKAAKKTANKRPKDRPKYDNGTRRAISEPKSNSGQRSRAGHTDADEETVQGNDGSKEPSINPRDVLVQQDGVDARDAAEEFVQTDGLDVTDIAKETLQPDRNRRDIGTQAEKILRHQAEERHTEAAEETAQIDETREDTRAEKENIPELRTEGNSTKTTKGTTQIDEENVSAIVQLGIIRARATAQVDERYREAGVEAGISRPQAGPINIHMSGETHQVNKTNQRATIEPDAIPPQFKRSELDRAGALELDEAQMPTLMNAVHPIWHYNCFAFPDDHSEQENIEAYTAFIPALRLATYWITERQFQDFWVPLWFPQSELLGEEDEETYVISQPAPDFTEALALCTAARFQEIADTFSKTGQPGWRFERQDYELRLAVTERPEITENIMQIEGIPGCMTRLHDNFRILPEILCKTRATTSMKLRFFFFLAIRLVRELVWHVFRYQWRFCRPNDSEPPDRSDVLYQLDTNNASILDIAWEVIMFGGPVYRINTAPIPLALDGFAVEVVELKPYVFGVVNDNAVDSKDDECTDVYAPIPMSWINYLFSAHFWEDAEHQDERNPGLRVIPRLCARQPATEDAGEDAEE